MERKILHRWAGEGGNGHGPCPPEALKAWSAPDGAVIQGPVLAQGEPGHSIDALPARCLGGTEADEYYKGQREAAETGSYPLNAVFHHCRWLLIASIPSRTATGDTQRVRAPMRRPGCCLRSRARA